MTKTAEQLIAEERARQINALSFTAAHDDEHRDGSLARAGRCYIATAEVQIAHGRPLPPCFIHKDWPWERRGWNPHRTDPVPNLVKGAALLRAEIERLSRLELVEDANHHMRTIHEVDLYGFNPEYKRWFFGDCAYTPDGQSAATTAQLRSEEKAAAEKIDNANERGTRAAN